jgi:DNA polymerase III epsilon subunit-like protein
MLLFLDTETTGVTPYDRIVSICWAVYGDAGQELSTTHHIIYPDGFTIPSDAAAIHGITTAIARQRGIPIERALSELRGQINSLHPGLYVGHNVSFDRPIVLNEYSRLGAQENLSPLPTFCTMEGTTHICRIPRYGQGGYKWPKLEELHRYLFGSPHDSAHDAEADVRACAKCYLELRSRNLIN